MKFQVYRLKGKLRHVM